jgi:serine/threonine-protein kinase
MLVVVALILAGLGIAYAAGLGGLLGGNKVIVPNLAGMTVAAAKAELTKDGLVLGQTSQDYSDTTPSGQISSQDPPQGGLAAKGAQVNVVISKGAQPVSVPSLVGQDATSAISAIDAAGFTAYAGQPKHNSAPEGQVIDQSPKGGSMAPKGSQITYVLSLGPQLNQIPDVTGKSRSSATSILKDAGFKVAVAHDWSDTVDKGLVIRQDPPAPGAYKPGWKMTITVSDGPSVKVPSVSGLTLSDAIDKIVNAGLAASPPSYDGTATTLATGTLPKSGSTVAKGSTVTIHYSVSY